MKLAALFLAPILLSGCVTAETMIADAGNQCAQLGYAPGTQRYLDCSLIVYQGDRNRRQASGIASHRAAAQASLQHQMWMNQTTRGH